MACLLAVIRFCEPDETYCGGVANNYRAAVGFWADEVYGV